MQGDAAHMTPSMEDGGGGGERGRWREMGRGWLWCTRGSWRRRRPGAAAAARGRGGGVCRWGLTREGPLYYYMGHLCYYWQRRG